MAIEHIRDVLQRLPAILMGGYESPAEECLGERLRSTISPTTTFQTQVWVDTSVGRFRLDLLLTDQKKRRIAIEVDGKDFHEPNRDHWRTVFIVGEGQADVLYRVPASDLKINLVGVLAGLGAVEPQCFIPTELSRLRGIVESTCANNEEDGWDDNDDSDDEGQSWRVFWERSSLAIESHLRSNASACMPGAIRPYYDFAKATSLQDLEAIKMAWERAHPQETVADGPPDPFDFFKSF